MSDGFLHDFLHGEGSVSGRVEVSGHGVQGALFSTPLLDVAYLRNQKQTVESLSCSATLTMRPKEGMTVMLMLLRLRQSYPSSEIWFWNDMTIRKWYFLNINKIYRTSNKYRIISYICNVQDHALGANFRVWVAMNCSITSRVIFLRFTWWSPTNFCRIFMRIFLI